MDNGKYRIRTEPVASLTPEQIRTEAEELRYQTTCVTASISSKRAWAQAEDRQDTTDFKIWLAKARDFLKRVKWRYAEILPREKALNRAQYTSRRHVTRQEFDQHIQDGK